MVLPTIIATTSVHSIAPGGPIVVVAPSSTAHVVAVLRLALVVEAVVHRGLFRGVPASSRCGAFGLLHRGSLEKAPEFAVDPSPLRGRGLGHCSD